GTVRARLPEDRACALANAEPRVVGGGPREHRGVGLHACVKREEVENVHLVPEPELLVPGIARRREQKFAVHAFRGRDGLAAIGLASAMAMAIAQESTSESESPIASDSARARAMEPPSQSASAVARASRSESGTE